MRSIPISGSEHHPIQPSASNPRPWRFLMGRRAPSPPSCIAATSPAQPPHISFSQRIQTSHSLPSPLTLATASTNLTSPDSPRRRAAFSYLPDHDSESTSDLELTPTQRNSGTRSAAAVDGRGIDKSVGSPSPSGGGPQPYHLADSPNRSSTSSRHHPPNMALREDGIPLLEGVEHERSPSTEASSSSRRRDSIASISSTSTTSLVLENLNEYGEHAAEKEGFLKKKPRQKRNGARQSGEYRDSDSDPEVPLSMREKENATPKNMTMTLKRALWICGAVAVVTWSLALGMFLFSGRHKVTTQEYDDEKPNGKSGRKITLEQIQRGEWHMRTAPITWIDGPNGEDGLVLEQGAAGKDYLVVEDIRSRGKEGESAAEGVEVFKAKTLMKTPVFTLDGNIYRATEVSVSPDMKKVLVLVDKEKVFRHSHTGLYFILDVASGYFEPLDPENPTTRVQLAQWSPKSDAVAFTRENNLFVRMMDSKAVRQITDDGGEEYFYGIPDWVYEEEVFSNRVATWWSRDGQFVAFMRTNETAVPEYPVDYYIARPSGKDPEKGHEHYPETKMIKYPKAGAPNPVVDLLFYDLKRNEHFEVEVEGGFKDDNRLITNVLWADDAKALVQEANRESDRIRYVLVDVEKRTGKTVRDVNFKELDLGWVEPAQKTTYVPADPGNGRPHDGYIDTAVHDGYDHLAYYSPIDSSKPTMLTSGKWEVDGGPAAVDLKNNLVYFISNAVAIPQRHVFSVSLTKPQNSITPITSVNHPGYWSGSFSSRASYASLIYNGPSVPYQKVISAPDHGQNFSQILESNTDLAQMASTHELPHLIYTNLTLPNNYTVQILERRPPHFNPAHQYPVVFYQYSGPGSQTVARRFTVDFQSYLAATQNYIVITVDGRGTGFSGLAHRKMLREHFGTVEPADQIAVAQHYAKSKKYVDPARMAIWGWSYGGYTTLKTLEMDAGRTFRYGMAVAPVTDWAFYDSIYTERYMLLPENNARGYGEAAVNNVTAMAENVRFLIMHGTGDDNVHMQNTLTLLDKFDLAGVGNYDVHVWPDSDHSIYFHGANGLVWERLAGWLERAFRGDYYEKVGGLGEGDGSR